VGSNPDSGVSRIEQLIKVLNYAFQSKYLNDGCEASQLYATIVYSIVFKCAIIDKI